MRLLQQLRWRIPLLRGDNPLLRLTCRFHHPRYTAQRGAHNLSHHLNPNDVPSIPGVVSDLGSQTTQSTNRCNGCGVVLQTESPNQPGYVPAAVTDMFSDGRIKRFTKYDNASPDFINQMGFENVSLLNTKIPTRTRLLTCERCYRLQHYKRTTVESSEDTANAETPKPDTSTTSIPPKPLVPSFTFSGLSACSSLTTETFIQRISGMIRPRSLILHLVDIMDFEASLVPELHEMCRQHHLEIIWVINKVDCIPERSRTLDTLLAWARKLSKQMHSTPVDRIAIISAKTGYNFRHLEEIMSSSIKEAKGRYMYVMGRTNCGKSTFVNRFLNHVGYTHQGTVDFQQEVGGVTQSALPGSTLDFVPFTLPLGYKLIDTPGVPSRHQLFSLSSNAGVAVDDIVFHSVAQPVRFKMRPGVAILIGSVARVEMISGSPVFLTVVVSASIPLQLVHMTSDTVTSSPSMTLHTVQVYAYEEGPPLDDLSIAGLGWITVGAGETDGERTFNVCVPEGVHVFRRPAIPVTWKKSHASVTQPSKIVHKHMGRSSLIKHLPLVNASSRNKVP